MSGADRTDGTARANGIRPEAPGEPAGRNGTRSEAGDPVARNGAGPARREDAGPGGSDSDADRGTSNGSANAGDRTVTAGGAVDAAGNAETPKGSQPGPAEEPAGARERAAGRSRRPPTVTRDTARPEGGGRAAPGDAPAPARQWPLLTVLGLAALGLLIVGADPFEQAFRVGTMLVGAALLTGAALRRVLPSVGMLAVRSRFTDMVTYGVLGTVIVLLALMVQPRPWLEIPFLEEAVRFTVR
ncbi:DUF3017 domain-containing protein [Streptomyces sp. ICN441]|uniref:DUF3017 domain-containing protein n=1 Tax=Streptomyces sp. ICN441 TaxID=2558286 RepID=UPI001069364C|nr:DUF3017 domain-containing protein [Streptomyces sp. ICN441]TFE51569.1 DUF3017 domain-containing protein [Streptomyces sp. ICN441]